MSLWFFQNKELRNKHIKHQGRCDDAAERKLTGPYSPGLHIPLRRETSNDSPTDPVMITLSIVTEKHNVLLELMQGEGASQGRLLGGYAISDPFYVVTMMS